MFSFFVGAFLTTWEGLRLGAVRANEAMISSWARWFRRVDPRRRRPPDSAMRDRGFASRAFFIEPVESLERDFQGSGAPSRTLKTWKTWGICCKTGRLWRTRSGR